MAEKIGFQLSPSKIDSDVNTNPDIVVDVVIIAFSTYSIR